MTIASTSTCNFSRFLKSGEKSANPCTSRIKNWLGQESRATPKKVAKPAALKVHSSVPCSEMSAPSRKSMLDQYREIPGGVKTAMRSFVTVSPETKSLMNDVKADLKAFHQAEKAYQKAVKSGNAGEAAFNKKLMELTLGRATVNFESLKDVLKTALYKGESVSESGRSRQIEKMLSLRDRMKARQLQLNEAT